MRYDGSLSHDCFGGSEAVRHLPVKVSFQLGLHVSSEMTCMLDDGVTELRARCTVFIQSVGDGGVSVQRRDESHGIARRLGYAHTTVWSCDECRIAFVSEREFDPYAAPRPPVRTTDDYLRERDQSKAAEKKEGG